MDTKKTVANPRQRIKNGDEKRLHTVEANVVSVVKSRIKNFDQTQVVPYEPEPKKSLSNGHLKIWRVPNQQSGGSHFVISKTEPALKAEAVITLYDPPRDVLAFERALRKYREENP